MKTGSIIVMIMDRTRSYAPEFPDSYPYLNFFEMIEKVVE